MRTLEQIRKEAVKTTESIAGLREQLALEEKRYAELVREAGEAAKAEIAGLAKGSKKKKNPPGVIDTTFDDEALNGASKHS